MNGSTVLMLASILGKIVRMCRVPIFGMERDSVTTRVQWVKP